MLNIAVCDDEKHIRDGIRDVIRDFFQAHGEQPAVYTFSSGKELLDSDNRIDIIFLDIQMPQMDGMEVARKLRARGFRGFLLFITVLPDPVYDAFSVQAFDYLLKPIQPERFERVMDRLLQTMQNAKDDVLLVRTGHESRLIPFDDIVYCEVIDRKIYVHLTGSEVVDYYDRIESLEKRLGDAFYRCHRSYLINLRYVRNCKSNCVTMEDGTQIPVSRLRAKDFSNVMLRYMQS